MKLRSWRWGWSVAALVAGSQIWAWSQSPEVRPRQALISVRAVEAEPFDAAQETAASEQSLTAASTRPKSSTVPTEPEASVAETIAGPQPAEQQTVEQKVVEPSEMEQHSVDQAPETTPAPSRDSVVTSPAVPPTETASAVATMASTDLAERPAVRVALRQAADRGEKIVPVEPVEPLDADPPEPSGPRGVLPNSNSDSTYDGVATNFKPLAKNTKQMITRAATAAKLPQADFAAKHFDGLTPLATDAVRSSQAPPRLTGPTAGDFCHRPLYFQEINLERYGSSWGFLQPAVSGARFFATVPALPYLMAVDNPNECYDLSYPYPAGFPAPRVRELPPLSVKGGLLEAGVMTGLIFLIP